MVSLVEALVLSVIQGITEWFPVSSSGHLALMHSVFGFQSLSYDVFLHLASILAVVVIFWKDIIGILYFKGGKSFKYLMLIIVALIPAGIAGLFLEPVFEGVASNFVYLGLFFIFSGVVIYSTKFVDGSRKRVGFVDSLFIGLFQAFAVLPGVSRSGMTISSGLFRGLSKRAAITFSFLLSIPLILGAGLFEAGDLVFAEIDLFILIVSFVVTFLVSLVTIRLLLRVIQSEKFWWFGVYDVVLGVVVLGIGIF